MSRLLYFISDPFLTLRFAYDYLEAAPQRSFPMFVDHSSPSADSAMIEPPLKADAVLAESALGDNDCDNGR